ncbi:MAG: hypothetical protein Tsb009_16880 [Planctomycetaceae bacterium]
MTGRIRVYLVGSRLYQLLAFYQEGADISKTDMKKFHDSFKRLKK